MAWQYREKTTQLFMGADSPWIRLQGQQQADNDCRDQQDGGGNDTVNRWVDGPFSDVGHCWRHNARAYVHHRQK